MSGAELADGINGAAMVVCNDYEFELIRQKTGFARAGCARPRRPAGDHQGRTGIIGAGTGRDDEVPAVTPDRIADPTGVGDAYRGGFMKGLAHGASAEVCARIGSVAATYCLEHLGGQSHAYTWAEFCERYEATFGALPI